MPVITQIKPQKKKNRVNIYLDGKFAFGLDLENLVKLGLKVEQELGEDEIEKIVKEAEFAKTFEKILRFSMLRPRSEKELYDWLKRKKVHLSLHKKIFERLKKLDLVDDEKFAKWWVDQRLNFRNKSVREITYELRLKGIEKDLINSALEEVKIDEVKSAKGLITKNFFRWRRFSTAERKVKILQYLLRKGFPFRVVKKAVEELELKG